MFFVHLVPVFPLAVLVTVGQKVTLLATLEGGLGGGILHEWLSIQEKVIVVSLPHLSFPSLSGVLS